MVNSVQPPPIYSPVVQDDGVATPPWILFFNEIYIGDTGTEWTPTFTNLTTVGAPTITGRYYKISQSLTYFSVRIVPGTSTTSTAGTTYIDNFPITIRNDGAVFAVAGLTGSGNPGQADAATNRIYTPAWTAVTVPLTITGTIEAR